MRPAGEIAAQFIPCTCSEVYTSREMVAPDCPLHAFDLESAINEARKEAIKECTEKVSCEDIYQQCENLGTNIADKMTRQSILSLIDELK